MFEIVSIILISAVLLGMAAHRLIFGPKRPEAPPAVDCDGVVARLSRLERLIHALLAISFFALAGTGLGAMWSTGEPAGWMLYAHMPAGAVFAAALTAAMIRWSAQNVFIRQDLRWLRHGFGGYFRRQDRHPAAGRFDAGQKIMFWMTATLGLITMLTILLTMQPWFGVRGQVILIEVHRYAGLLLLALVMIHLYAMLQAKPGSWRAMFQGKMSATWARTHHALWFEDACSQGDSTCSAE